MNLPKFALITFGAVLLSGCVSLKQADERILAWQSSNLDDLIQAWGLPTKEVTVASRNYLVWNNEKQSSDVGVGITLGTGGRHGGISLTTLLGGDAEQNMCSRVVEIDEERNILGIQWNGEPSLCFDVTPEK